MIVFIIITVLIICIVAYNRGVRSGYYQGFDENSTEVENKELDYDYLDQQEDEYWEEYDPDYVDETPPVKNAVTKKTAK